MRFRLPLLAALVTVLCAVPAQALDCRSTTSGDFTTVTWDCGVAPDADDTAIIAGNMTVTLDADVSVLRLTIEAGSTFDNGSATLTLVDPAGALLTNDGTFTGNAGTVVFAEQGAVLGSSAVAFENVTIRGGVDFAASGSSSSVRSTFAIEAGGFVQDQEGGATPPTYIRGAILRYDTGSPFSRGAEWTPTAAPSNVFVFTGTTLALGTPAGTLSTGQLSISGTLDMGTSNQPLDVNGNLLLSGGTIRLSSTSGGDLFFAGGVFQVSGGGALNANGRIVTFDRPSSVGAPIFVSGSVVFDFVTIATGGLNVAAFNAITINQGLTQTSGQLYLTGAGGTLATSAPAGLTGTTASATLEGDAGWRLLSVPASGLSSAELDDDGAATQLTPDPNLLTGYDGSAFTSPSALPTALNAAEGFFLYLFDNDRAGSQSLPITLDIDGADPGVADDPRLSGLNQDSGNAGSNMIGNPFRNAFDITKLIGVGDPAPQAAQIWTDAAGPGGGGTYVSTTTLGDVIPVWNGAFVDISSGGATDLIFPDLAQVDGAGTFQNRRQLPSYVQLVLTGTDAATGATTRDEAAIAVFTVGGTDDWDSRDMRKLVPFGGAYATLAFVTSHDFGEGAAPQLKAQESRGLDGGVSLPVHLDAAGTGETLTIEPVLSALPSGWTAVLEDREAGTRHDLSEGPYSFSAQAKARRSGPLRAHSPQARLGAGDAPRFVLHVGPSALTTAAESGVLPATLLGPIYPNPTAGLAQTTLTVATGQRVRAVLVDVLGRTVRIVLDADLAAGAERRIEVDLDGLASGTYVLRVTGDSFSTARRLTVLR